MLKFSRTDRVNETVHKSSFLVAKLIHLQNIKTEQIDTLGLFEVAVIWLHLPDIFLLNLKYISTRIQRLILDL